MATPKHRHILVRYIMKPKNPKLTHVKGYMSTKGNQRWDELVEFSVGLKIKDELKYQIIIDIDGQKVIKNSISGNYDWAQLMDYYVKAYEPQLINFLKKTAK